LKRAELLENLHRKQAGNEFPEGGAYAAYVISHLSGEDLDRLFRLTSQGKQDREFLPQEFWFELSTMFYHWEPGAYFGKKYVFFGQIISPGEISQNWRDFAASHVDPDGRSRMAAAITVLAGECLSITGEPTLTQRSLIHFVHEFLFRVWLGEGENSLLAQFNQALDEDKIATAGDADREIDAVISQPDPRRHPLLDLWQRCQKNENFRKFGEANR
jgi:hypothetical protein